MSTTHKVPGTLIAALATVALVAPAAGAMPIHESSEFDSGHASTATAAAQKQDFRSADARDAAIHPKRYAFPTPSSKSLPGAPTWASNPQPLHSVQASSTTSDDDSFPWTLVIIGLSGVGLAAGGAAVGVSKTGKRSRARVAA
jgi:hypothetical protein